VASWPPRGKQIAIVDPVVTVGLNVRNAPGQNHVVTSVVYEDDKLAVLTRTTNWARVLTQDGTRGWVLRRYLDDPGFSSPSAPRTITAETPVLHLRSGPGKQYGVTGAVFKGTKMQLVRLTPHWAAVILPGGTTGWVARPYTSNYQPVVTRPSPALAQAIYVRVIASVLNIRSAPGHNHPVIAQVYLNTHLQLLSITAHWEHVALPVSRIDGWVLRTYTR
jgi:N-acetylmuramoyl-L-alanine amidase